MKTTSVITVNKEKYVGVLWTFRPDEGWMEILDETTGVSKRFNLGELLSAVTERVQITPKVVQDIDLLVDARKRGWNGR